MNKKVAELEEARDTGKPGAQQILRSFRAERIMAADAIVEVRDLVPSFVLIE
jgi:hypothetical protein